VTPLNHRRVQKTPNFFISYKKRTSRGFCEWQISRLTPTSSRPNCFFIAERTQRRNSTVVLRLSYFYLSMSFVYAPPPRPKTRPIDATTRKTRKAKRRCNSPCWRLMVSRPITMHSSQMLLSADTKIVRTSSRVLPQNLQLLGLTPFCAVIKSPFNSF
jgi:hypothetical protein